MGNAPAADVASPSPSLSAAWMILALITPDSMDPIPGMELE